MSAAAAQELAIDEKELAELAKTPMPGILATKGSVPFPGPASAEIIGEGTLPERLAVAIGINHYDQEATYPLAPLANAEKDAQDVADELRNAGFVKYVLTGKNGPVTRNAILNKLSDMLSHASDSIKRTGRPPVLLFYFAGHGINFDGVDYLLPSDFSPSFAEDIPAMAISVPEIRRRLEWAGASLYIVISDACRAPFSLHLTRRSRNGEIITVINEHTTTGVLLDAKPISEKMAQGKNDVLISFATIKDRTASDVAVGSANGAFAAAFLNAMRRARKTVQNPTADGAETDLISILDEAGTELQADTKGNQKAEMLRGGRRFLLYPTTRNYKRDQLRWLETHDLAGKLIKGEAANVKLQAKIAAAYYCLFRIFTIANPYYGYYGYAGLKILEQYHKAAGSCDSLSSGTSPLTEAPAQTRNARARVPSETAARLHLAEIRKYVANDAQQVKDKPPVTVGDVLKSQHFSEGAKAELRAFDPDARIDELAVVAASTGFFANPELRDRPIGMLRDGDLVQVTGRGALTSSGATIAIKAGPQRAGFVEQKLVDSGRVALAFDVEVDPEQGKVSFDEAAVNDLFTSAIASDVVIQVRRSELVRAFRSVGLVIERLQDRWQPFGDRSGIVPKLSVADEEASAKMKEGVIRVAVTVLPLQRALRLRVASISGSRARITDAIFLSALRETNPTARRAISMEPSPECLEAARAIRDLKSYQRVATFVQFKTDEDRERSEAVRRILRASGFSVRAQSERGRRP